LREIAKGVEQLCGFPRNVINSYLVEDVLIDCATRWARWRILRRLRGRPVKMVALTHCHPDHQGTARAVCETFGVPLACHEADVAVMEGRAPMAPQNSMVQFADRFWSGPPYRVARVLQGGEEIAGFRVIHTPGHTLGHVSYFRESDRLAIAGDVLANIHFVTGAVGLRVPPDRFCVDPEQNRRSIRILADLRPAIVCFGHGPPLYDADVLQRFVERHFGSAPDVTEIAARTRG
jgi:glyoxylase-like metal-dependent hydrolase (beta-lactamase superfamily II)